MKISEIKRISIFGSVREFDSAHAPTVLEMKNGRAMAAWFGGRWEKDPDTAIFLSRQMSGGEWERPRKVADTYNVAAWNPVLFRSNNGDIILFYKIGAEISKWHTEYIVSHDEGETWSEPRELVPGDIGGRGPVKNKPIYLSDNKTIVAPASLEGESWNAFVDISDDNGKTWHKSEFVPVRRVNPNERAIRDRAYNKYFCFGKGVIQPTLWQDDSDVLHMLLRTTSSRIFESRSLDGGRTWSIAEDTGIPNNNSGIDAARLPGGGVVLACNPRENIPGMTKGPRTPLALMYIDDNGDSRTELCRTDDGDGAYAYPSIVSASGDRLMLVYSENRQNIIYCEIKYVR